MTWVPETGDLEVGAPLIEPALANDRSSRFGCTSSEMERDLWGRALVVTVATWRLCKRCITCEIPNEVQGTQGGRAAAHLCHTVLPWLEELGGRGFLEVLVAGGRSLFAAHHLWTLTEGFPLRSLAFTPEILTHSGPRTAQL